MLRTCIAPALIAIASTLAAAAGPGTQQPPASGGAQDQVAALKQSLQDGLAKGRQYEWVETTIISLKGEEKARKQNRCYYGADGKVQKTPMGDAAPPQNEQAGRPGRRGGGRVKEQIIENKKEDMQEYMQRAGALVHQYVPPDPARIQAAKDAKRVAVTPQAGGPVRVAISDYAVPGDSLTIDLDPAANRLLGLGVNSYLDEKDDAVTLAVRMATLADGALYAAQATLNASAKNIQVVIQNSGHRPVAK